jgi:hypothetical protein
LQAPPSDAQSQFRKKWNALDDALDTGAITKAEYDKKLSVRLRQSQHKRGDR